MTAHPPPKLDLRKQWKALYSPSARQAQIVDVPALLFVMIDGAIEPGSEPGRSPAFAQALEALYGISYTLKFMSKQRAGNPIDYTVMGLEAQWWIEGGVFDYAVKDNWCWTAMIPQPDHITDAMFVAAAAKLASKKPNPALERLRLQHFAEGLSVQIMHLGPYADEPATIERMHAYAAAQGYGLHGKHHEIYLSDPLRTAPEKLKTILRHPVEKLS